MTDEQIDLTAAVEAGARAAARPGNYDNLKPYIQHNYREHVLPIVTAALDAVVPELLERLKTLQTERDELDHALMEARG